MTKPLFFSNHFVIYFNYTAIESRLSYNYATTNKNLYYLLKTKFKTCQLTLGFIRNVINQLFDIIHANDCRQSITKYNLR